MKPSAIITGGGRGLGRALANELVGSGYQVGLVARNEANLKDACEELRSRGGTAHYRIADITDRDGLQIAMSELVEALGGRLDLLIVNAARINWVKDERFPREIIEGIFQTNVMGAIYTVDSVAELMMAQRSGQIAAISSLGSFIGDTGSGLKYYYASKTALNAIFAAYRRHFREHGISVNTIAPGWIDTDMFDATRAEASETSVHTAEEAAKKIIEAIAEKRDDAFPRSQYRRIRYHSLTVPIRREIKRRLIALGLPLERR